MLKSIDPPLTPTARTIDTPGAKKIVILGLVPSIRACGNHGFLGGITKTCAAWDPRVTHEDDDDGEL